MESSSKENILNVLNKTFLKNCSTFSSENNENLIQSIGKNLFNGLYKYEHGLSKLVIIPHNENFVIKIPYTGSTYIDYKYDYKYHYCNSIKEYYEFSGGCEERFWDYCGEELARYNIAKNLNLQDFFAKIELLGFINKSYPIYIQEKCQVYSSLYNTRIHSIFEKTQTSNICRQYHFINININWLTDFRFFYGTEKLINFITSIHNLQWDDDLRDDNIGYIQNRPVLIDYAGFEE